MLDITRGTTPTCFIYVKEEIPLQNIRAVWVFVSQNNKVKIDKVTEDITIDYDHHYLTVKFSQEDTLNLKAGEAMFQVRVLLNNDALASYAKKIKIYPVYKEGVITSE